MSFACFTEKKGEIMEVHRKNGVDEERVVQEDAERRLSKELLDFTYARLPQFRWLRRMYAPADGATTA
jgi:hypothetical protein